MDTLPRRLTLIAVIAVALLLGLAVRLNHGEAHTGRVSGYTVGYPVTSPQGDDAP